jgi:DNA adenine methylase
VHDLSDAEHRALADVLHRVKGMVVLSGYPNDLYEELYRGWRRLDHHARDDAANLSTESLWLNPAAQQRSRTTTASHHPSTLPR